MSLFPGLVLRLVGAVVAASGVSGGANAQAAPTVRVIVPCPAGSPADIFARHLAEMLSQSSGQKFDVENVASGALDTAEARRVQDDERAIFFLPAGPALPPACGD